MSLQHRIEYRIASACMRLFRGLGPVRASNLAGALGRSIGPLIPVSRLADRNLRAAMPELDEAARKCIIRAVWDNLARNIAELPHLSRFRESAAAPGYEVIGTEHLRAATAQGGPAIILTAHLGNWEIMPLAAQRLGIPTGFFYRAASNPLVDRMILDLRAEAIGEGIRMFPKGAAGARGAYAHLAGGGVLAILADQKLNDGLEVPFFGMPAMTAPTLAILARKFGCPVLPVHVERLGAARLRVVCGPPLLMPRTGDRQGDIQAMTALMNRVIEGWIRARPGEWLWLHRRWPKTVVK